jgi:serine/threonine protein kinase
MSFDPKPGFYIHLDNDRYDFVPSLKSNGQVSDFVYSSSGREGTVYKVKKDGKFFALKVLFPGYQNKNILVNNPTIYQYKDTEGLKVAERIIVNRDQFIKLIKKYPELEFSVLMPWIEGNLWMNFMEKEIVLDPELHIQIARQFTKVICNLEERGIAHCDLSNQNFIISYNNSSVELIDIERMYAPGIPRPKTDVSFGTSGYRNPRLIDNGLWSPESDRFAFAILIAEILTWIYPEIRMYKMGPESYFDEEDIGEKCDRYQIMIDCLGRYHRDLQDLFNNVWFSNSLEQCPEVRAWMKVIENVNLPESTISNQIEEKKSTKVTKADIRPRNVGGGLPPKMMLSHSNLDFGVVTQSNNSMEFTISNYGGSQLTGTLTPANWLTVTPSQFSILPGSQVRITVSLKSNLPQPKNGYDYRAPFALKIETDNEVNEVLSGSFKFPKKPWYSTFFS